MDKAYRIHTKADITSDSYGIYGGETAGQAKTSCMAMLWEIYGYKANYSWIIFCRRSPEYDNLVNKYSGCVSWKQGNERWEQDNPRCHWWE